jgi:hypothetical protein
MRKFCLETHRFAPELNKIHFLGADDLWVASIPTPQMTRIADVKKKLFPSKLSWHKIARVYRGDQLLAGGIYTSYSQIKSFLANRSYDAVRLDSKFVVTHESEGK